MRLPSKASSALVALAVTMAGACADGTVSTPGNGGLGILAQQAPGHDAFYWTRAVYSASRGRNGWGDASWATDVPKGDRQFLVVLKRLVRFDAYDWEYAVSLADPRIRRFPLLCAVEVGHMDLTPEETHGLRDYLNAGGMLVVDDFWGTREWDQL